MELDDGTLIRVHRGWADGRAAEVRLGDLRDVHWFQPDHAPHPLVHAYVSCTDVVTGDIPHECDRASTPHRLLVCILKRHAIPSVHAELARRADQQRTLALNGVEVSALTVDRANETIHAW